MTKKLLAGAVIAGLMTGAKALAADAAPEAKKDAAAVEKNSCHGKDMKDHGKNSCKGKKKKKNACSGKNGCDGMDTKKDAKETEKTEEKK